MAHHLILGSDGFIGRHLAASLIAAGEAVTGVGSGLRPAFGLPAGLQRRAQDLFASDASALKSQVAKFDVVYNLVWSSIPASAEQNPERDLNDNVGLIVRLLEAVRGTSTRLVFVSSGGAVYGHGIGRPFREEDTLRPIGAYGAAKAAAELYALAAYTMHGTDVRVARLSNPFGAGQAKSALQGSVSRFTGLALAGEPIPIWGDGSVVRDYLYISDAVLGLRLLGTCERDEIAPYPIVNIGSGKGTSLIEIVALIEGILGRSVEVKFLPGRAFDVASTILDVKRARDALRWQSEATLRDGVRQLVEDLQSDPERYCATPFAPHS